MAFATYSESGLVKVVYTSAFYNHN